VIHQRVGQGESRRTAERAMPFVHVLIDQHGKTQDNVLMSGAVLRRASPDEIRVDKVRSDQHAIAASTNFLDGLTTILCIPRIPSPSPDTPHEAARARPRLPERIALMMRRLPAPARRSWPTRDRRTENVRQRHASGHHLENPTFRAETRAFCIPCLGGGVTRCSHVVLLVSVDLPQGVGNNRAVPEVVTWAGLRARFISTAESLQRARATS